LIKKRTLSVFLLFIFIGGFAGFSSAQNNEKKNEAKETRLPVENEPGPAQPYGRLNPDAPPETGQFSFMIGEFDCVDKLPGKDGQWTESKVVWNSSYFLNGAGIQDKFWSPSTVASGTRIFDKNRGKWIVNYFQTEPRYFAGTWEGKKEGDKMIMRLKQGDNENRLTFHNIKEDGFDWIGELVNKEGKAAPFWIISCKRRR
jgi:hypothetical protein